MKRTTASVVSMSTNRDASLGTGLDVNLGVDRHRLDLVGGHQRGDVVHVHIDGQGVNRRWSPETVSP